MAAPVGRVLALGRKNTGSHHAYAIKTLSHLSVRGCSPTSVAGELYVLNADNNIWEPLEYRDLTNAVANLSDGQKNCSRHTDYTGIAEQMLAIANDKTFFDKAPVGLACVGSFFHVEGDRVVVEPLQPSHRQRVMLDFEPLKMPTPLFDEFLRQTFRSDAGNDEEQQRRLVQEIMGAVLLGIMPKFQKAVLFYDPIGRAGKGTLEKIIGRLVPEGFTSAESPYSWSKEYNLAAMKGKRLNVVGELPEDGTIPAAAFKAVIGGDPLSGRQIMRAVETFRNEAAHIFTSNHFITTKDHSEAFFARWLLVEFPNSLLKSGQRIDTGLADRIIAQEMPGIAWWAMQGGLRLLQQDRFSTAVVHDRLLEKWKRSTSSLDEYIHECCDLGIKLYVEKGMFNRGFKAWCTNNGRKPYSSQKVRALMENRLDLPVRISILDGDEVIRGLGFKDTFLKSYPELK